MDTVEKPIVVPDTTLPTMVATAVRYALTFLGGLLVTKGILPGDTDVNQIVGVVLVVASTVYGVWKSKRNTNKMQTMAQVLPDSIATVK